MRYSLLQRIFCCSALLIFSFSACHSSAQNNGINNPLSENTPSDNQELQDRLPTTPSEDTGVWDTSDIDISQIDKTRKLVAFTFDDAPSRTLENVFAVFTEFNEKNPECPATATVFFNGIKFDEQTPHLLATALTLRFELGNHTHSHFDLTTLSKAELQKEIDETDRFLSLADGKPSHLLRAPFGRLNEFVKPHANAPWINWTIDTLDWTGRTEDEIYTEVMANVFDGAIVLMHDGYTPTVSALKRLLPDLKAKGFQVVNVSQMIKAQGRTFYNGKEYIRATKNKNAVP